MTVLTVAYPQLVFSPSDKNANYTQKICFSSNFQPSIHHFAGKRRRVRKLAVVRAQSGMVIEKEHEFKPSFDEYLKVMETVKSRREKRNASTGTPPEIDEGIDELSDSQEQIRAPEVVNLKQVEVRKTWTPKKLDSRIRDTNNDVPKNDENYLKYQEIIELSDSQNQIREQEVANLKQDEVRKTWTRKKSESRVRDSNNGVQVNHEKYVSFQGRLRDPDVEGFVKDSVVNKKRVAQVKKLSGSGFKSLDECQDKQGELMKKWTRKKLDYEEPQMVSNVKSRDTDGFQKTAKFQEQRFRGSEVSSITRESYNSKIDRVVKHDHNYDDNMEIERAAFKSFEESQDVCDQPRVSRVDMEERIQRLAKCLNGASIDSPEWNFSKMMRSAKIRFADFSMIRLIQILGNYGNWRQVLQVIEWMQARERFKSNRIRNIYTAALDALGKARRPVEALNVFHTMQQQMASYPDLVAYRSIAVTLGQAGHMRELFHVIDSMRSPPKKKLPTGVLKKWDPRLEPDIIVYNAVLNACVRQKNLDGAFWVFQQLKEQGQKPNSITYGLVMEVMLACEKYNLVHEFFKKMQKSFIPNSLTYKVLVNTFWREGKVDEAIRAVEDMEKRGIVGSASLYYDLARCLSSQGRCKEALVQIEKVCKVANKPLVVTYTGLIQASLDSGKIESGIYIFNHMHKFCSPNLVTYNIMLKAYLDNHMFEEARNLFHKLLENGNHVTNRNVVLPDIHAFNLMLDACLVNQRWDDLEFFYTKMLQHGYYFNGKRHSRMILEASKAGKVNLLETTWKKLIEGNQVPPPCIVQEMFCMKLEQGDYASAFSCLICIPSTESHKYSRNSWLHRFRDDPQLFREERIHQMINILSLRNKEQPNPIILNLLRSCKQFLDIQ